MNPAAFFEWWEEKCSERERNAMAGMIWGSWLGSPWTSPIRDRSLCLWKAIMWAETHDRVYPIFQRFLPYCPSLPPSENPLLLMIASAAPLAVAAHRWNLRGSQLDDFLCHFLPDVCPMLFERMVQSYVRILRHLLRSSFDPTGTMDSLKGWLHHIPQDDALFLWLQRFPLWQMHCALVEVQDLYIVPWCQVLFSLQYFLEWSDGVERAVRESPPLSSDAAGAMVGAVLGALHGFRMLPFSDVHDLQQDTAAVDWLRPRHWLDAYRSPEEAIISP